MIATFKMVFVAGVNPVMMIQTGQLKEEVPIQQEQVPHTTGLKVGRHISYTLCKSTTTAANWRPWNARWQQTYQVKVHCLRSSEHEHNIENIGIMSLPTRHLLLRDTAPEG